MGRASRDKGSRRERQVVALLQLAGCQAQRVPLSGAAGGSFKGDILFRVNGRGKATGEVKGRADGSGFKTIERWLGDNDALFLIRDHAPPLVVMPWGFFDDLLREINAG